jgi:hypothetical protein
MRDPDSFPRSGQSRSRGQRFLGSRYWLVLKNVIGWPLILLSFVAGPLVPGPGGIPLFLIGFALISFPGKRRLTARVLRGKPVRLRTRPFALISLCVALTVAAVTVPVARSHSQWMAARSSPGPLADAMLYGVTIALIWLIVRVTPHVMNAALRLVARARRTFRPWLRHHRIRLLPPRWRRRHPHEPGKGPMRLTDEILRFSRRHRRRD